MKGGFFYWLVFECIYGIRVEVKDRVVNDFYDIEDN